MPGEGFTHGPPATKKAGGSHHRCNRSTGIPCAAVLTLIRDLLGVPGLLATVARRDHHPRTWRQRRGARTTRFHVRIDIVRRRTDALRADAATATHLACRDDRAQRPSRRGGMTTENHDFRKSESDLFFAGGLDRPNQIEPAHEIAFSARDVTPAKGADAPRGASPMQRAVQRPAHP